MTAIPKEICNQIISEKLNGFAYIINFDTYDIVYMAGSLAAQLQADGRGVGHKCYEVMHNKLRPCPACPKNNITENKAYTWKKHYQEGKRLFSSTDYVFEYNDQKYLVHTNVDVTQEMETIQELQQHASISDTIINCASALINREDPTHAIEALLQILAEFYDAEFAYLVERDYKQDICQCTHYFHADRSALTDKDFEFSYSIADCHRWVDYIQGKEFIFTEPTLKTTSIFPIQNHPISISNTKNYLFTPLVLDGTTIGTICIANLRTSLDTFEPVTQITAFIINSLSTKYAKEKLQHAMKALQKRNSFNQTLLECTQTLLLGEEIHEALTRLLFIMCEYFKARFVCILERDYSDQTISPTYWHAHDDDVDTIPHKVSFDVFDDWFEKYKEHGVVFMPALEKMHSVDRTSAEYAFLKERKLHSFSMSPLYEKGDKIGFLWIENPQTNLDNLAFLSTSCVFIVNHISKDRLMKKFEHLSFTDKLTNMNNRNYYINYLNEMQKKIHTPLGTVYADLNGLKIANDRLGHEYGDILLKWCGKFFTSLPNTTACRIGGDEFICFVEGIDEVEFEEYMDNIRLTLSKIKHINISIGSVWSDDASSVDKLVQEADRRMYAAKQQYYARLASSTLSDEEEMRNFKEAILGLSTYRF